MSTESGDAKADVENSPPRKPEREATKKIIRVLTVLAYLSSVSTAAIMLSLYYIFLWNPMPPNAAQIMPTVSYRQMPEIIPKSDRVLNRTWLAPEEPRALPVQIGEPPRINDDIAHLHSDESVPSWESEETAMRGKRSLRKVLNVLKLVGTSS